MKTYEIAFRLDGSPVGVHPPVPTLSFEVHAENLETAISLARSEVGIVARNMMKMNVELLKAEIKKKG